MHGRTFVLQTDYRPLFNIYGFKKVSLNIQWIDYNAEEPCGWITNLK